MILPAPNAWARSPLWVRAGGTSIILRNYNSSFEQPWVPPSVRYKPSPIHHVIDMVKAESCSVAVAVNFTPGAGGGAVGTWTRNLTQTGPNTSYFRPNVGNSAQSADALMRFFTVTPYQPLDLDIMLNGGWLLARGRWRVTGTFSPNPAIGLARGALTIGVLPHKHFWGRLKFHETRFSTQVHTQTILHLSDSPIDATFNLRMRPLWVAYVELVPPVFDYPFDETPRELFHLTLNFQRLAPDPTQLL